MIKFSNVTKVYGKNHLPALNDVSFQIERGEFVFLVGQSGSGKSTLLSLILRSLRTNSGEILVAGKNLTNLTNWRVPEYRQQLGVVFQNFRLLQNKTVYQNVAFALQVINKPKRVIETLVPEALKTVGLEDKAQRMPWELSGGEQQRVAIARAFVNRPLIILADEPTGNLDPATSDEIMRVFEMISKMGTTILMATHSEDIVNRYKKRVIELENGVIVRDEQGAKYGVSHTSKADASVYEEVFVKQEEPAAIEVNENPQTAQTSVMPAQLGDPNLTVRIAKTPRKAKTKSLEVDNFASSEQIPPVPLPPVPEVSFEEQVNNPDYQVPNYNTGEFEVFDKPEPADDKYEQFVNDTIKMDRSKLPQKKTPRTSGHIPSSNNLGGK